MYHTEDRNRYQSDDCSQRMLPSDTPKEFDRHPERATKNSRDSAGTTNYYSIAFSPRKIPLRKSGFAIHRTQVADRGTDEFGSLNEDTTSPIPESDSIPAPVSRIDDRDRKDDAYDYPLGVEDDDELYLEEPGTWDGFDNQIWLDDDHWAEVESRELGNDEGFPPRGTSIGQYFDAGDIYDQEDIQVSVYEEKEEGYDVRNDLVDIMGEEFRLRENAWSFHDQNGPLEF